MGRAPFATPAARQAPGALGPWTYTVVGVMLAIIGFIGVLIFSSHGTGIGGSTTPVVVAARDISLRSTLSAGDLKVTHVDTSSVAPGSYTSVQPLIGQIAAVNFVAGQPILQNLVSSSPSTVVQGATAYLPIPRGFVALTIPTAEQQGVGGYIQTGDYISMIATVNSGKFPIARTVFTNVHIIRVGPASAASTQPSGTLGSSQAAGVSSSLTVVLSECDAEYLTWFLTYSSLRYTLESYQDYQSQGTQTADASCPAVTAAKGVTVSDVQRRWPGLLTGG